MAARILEVCDAVVAKLVADNPGLACRRVYAPDEDDAGGSYAVPQVRTVYVMPAAYGQDGTMTRAGDLNGRRVGVVVVTPLSVPPTVEEIDAEVEFVQTAIYDVFSDPRNMPVLGAGEPGVWPDTAEVVSVYEPDELRRGVFVSQVDIGFREVS